MNGAALGLSQTTCRSRNKRWVSSPASKGWLLCRQSGQCRRIPCTSDPVTRAQEQHQARVSRPNNGTHHANSGGRSITVLARLKRKRCRQHVRQAPPSSRRQDVPGASSRKLKSMASKHPPGQPRSWATPPAHSTARPQEHGFKSTTSTARSQEHGLKSTASRARLQEHGLKGTVARARPHTYSK